MTKIINAKKKISRKLKVNLWGRSNDPFLKRNYKPGEHGLNLKGGRVSDYGRQLKAKQQLRKYHNITEKQFKSIFKEAARIKGDTSESFITLLELRLDTVVYRANFAPTIFSARQLVSHKHLLVNDKKVNIASYRLKVGDVIQIAEKSKNINFVIESLDKLERDIPSYLKLDKDKRTVEVIASPTFEEVPYPVEMQPNLVVEFYSR